jgi:hypothetical protein
VTPLLLDEHLADKNLARQLRAAGCVIETPQEAGLLGLDDPSILEAAIQRDAVFVTFNQRHFVPLHDAWQSAGRHHPGILLSRRLGIGQLSARLERAARLLARETARDQLMVLDLFDTEDRARAYVAALSARD